MLTIKWLLSAVLFQNQGVPQDPMVLQNEVFGDSLVAKPWAQFQRQVYEMNLWHNVHTLFLWHSFGSEGAKGVSSMRSCQKFPPCLIDQRPGSSRMGPLLSKAKPFSNCGISWPQPPFPVLLHHWGEEGRKIRSEVKPRKKGWMGRRCFEIFSYYPALVQLIIK